VVPAIRTWVQGNAVDVAAYQRVRAQAQPIGYIGRSKTTPPPAEPVLEAPGAPEARVA
jgi:hypothetical protein